MPIDQTPPGRDQDTARLESGQMPLHCRPVALYPFFHDLMDQMAGSADTGRIQVDGPDTLPPVQADPDHLERVLVNLLSNARDIRRRTRRQRLP